MDCSANISACACIDLGIGRCHRRRRTTAMTAASASAPDSDGLDSLDESLGRGGARKPSFPSPAAAVIAFERAVSQRLPRQAAVGRPAIETREGGEGGGLDNSLGPGGGVSSCVSFFNCYASNIFIYFHHPYSSSSSSTPPSTPFPSTVSVEMAAIPSNPSAALAASLSSSSL